MFFCALKIGPTNTHVCQVAMTIYGQKKRDFPKFTDTLRDHFHTFPNAPRQIPRSALIPPPLPAAFL